MPRTPTFGILVARATQPGQVPVSDFLGNYARDLIEAFMKRGWTAYVCSPDDILRQRHLAWGWTRSAGRWKREFLPLPHIGYLRSVFLSKSDRQHIDWLRKDQYVQFLNQPEVEEITQDRWRTIQIGLSHPTLSERFADSLILSSASLAEMIEAHPLVTLLPRYNFSQRGRFGLIRRQAAEYLWRSSSREAAETRVFQDPRSLVGAVVEAEADAIVQPAPALARFENCPVAFRVVWQRGADQRWLESCCVLRLGQPGTYHEPFTTLGNADRLAAMLNTLLAGNWEAVRYQLSNVSKTFIELIDHRGHGASELSVDILLLEGRRLQITNASTFGGLQLLKKMSAPGMRARMLQRTIDGADMLYKQAFDATGSTSSRS